MNRLSNSLVKAGLELSANHIRQAKFQFIRDFENSRLSGAANPEFSVSCAQKESRRNRYSVCATHSSLNTLL